MKFSPDSRIPRVACVLLLCAAFVSCNTGDDLYDFDGDGTPDSQDCGADNPAVYPGAPDPYGDDLDANCDGSDGIDTDGDGYPSNEELATTPELFDCNDSDASIHPGADDETQDAVDQNCDGIDGSGEGPMGVPVVTITPSSPLTTDTLSAEVSTDLGTPTLSWFKNGEEQSDLADTTVVLASATARDETWTAQASVQVGTEATPRVGSSFVTIGNTPPVISSVDLSPNAGTVETIFACEATASDADLSEWDDEVLCLDP